jgi:hypothetical protein
VPLVPLPNMCQPCPGFCWRRTATFIWQASRTTSPCLWRSFSGRRTPIVRTKLLCSRLYHDATTACESSTCVTGTSEAQGCAKFGGLPLGAGRGPLPLAEVPR